MECGWLPSHEFASNNLRVGWGGVPVNTKGGVSGFHLANENSDLVIFGGGLNTGKMEKGSIQG